MSGPLRDDILNFYAGFSFPPPGTRIDKCVVQRWSQTWVELTRLRSFELLDSFDQPNPQPEPPQPTASAENFFSPCIDLSEQEQPVAGLWASK
jgi:hypothetical protein